MVASTAYLQTRPDFKSPQDLVAQEFISLAQTSDVLTLSQGGEQISLPMENFRVEVDSVTAGKAAVLAGLGVMSLPLNEIESELQAGALVEVMANWKLAALGIFAVWPDSGPQKNLTHRMIDFLVARRDSFLL